jgi:topoisomerase-4 subunit A
MKPDSDTSVIDTPFDAALSERYLVYALSTITARSLPDVRDGLKPVHRRLLWAMRLLKLDPASAYKKCARVVGDVIGKYHPHGDQSVYDAMVRLAQDFALRYPLVDGQGNFGNIDGDNAAAYRYTEARLTATAARLMAGLDEGTVDYRATYNGEDEEPEVFPGLFPNLLANGSSGIAVGMATSIPPHHVGELIEAASHLIDNPGADDRDLMDFVQGPDFPTGGVLVDGREAIALAYKTGRGSFRLRARIEVEREKGGGWHLLVSEIPYGVQKGKLIEAIAGLIGDKKLPILARSRKLPRPVLYASVIASRPSTSTPPVGKSGPWTKSIRSRSSAPGLSIRCDAASINSPTWCGGIEVAIPTAIPDDPLASKLGNSPGNTSGSSSSPL